MVVERGTAARDARAARRVGTADVVITRRLDRGTAIYLNLTPVEYYDNSTRLASRGRQWRALLSRLLREAGLEPRATVQSQGSSAPTVERTTVEMPMVETLFWRSGDRTLLGVVMNPSRQASVDSASGADCVSGAAIDIDIQLARDYPHIRNLRTNQVLPPGRVIRSPWLPCEALLFELR
jgi:hypothetical protein